MTTPSDLEVLIHFHVCALPHPRAQAPAVQDAIRRFTNAGILEPEPAEGGQQAPAYYGCYQTTEKGRAWLSMILATPYPKTAYVDPRSGETVKPR